MLKRIMVIACLLAFTAALTGCNTMNGVGKDFQASGQALSDLAS